jgi:hypothetical protein
MAKGKGKGSMRAAPATRGSPRIGKQRRCDSDVEDDQEDCTKIDSSNKKENEMLKMKLLRLQKKLKLDRTGAARNSASSGTQTAMVREVSKCTKSKLWKVCKFIKNHAKLDKATKFVMETLDLTEMEGLKGKELVEAQEVWKAKYSGVVRQALNKQRNYVQQEIRHVLLQNFKQNKEKEFPNIDQMLELIMRNKLDEDTEEAERHLYEKIFDNYWNVLMPKVAGHARWGPTKRHYELLSTGKEDLSDKNAPTYVSASDEAFLAVLWMNCYNKWWSQEQKRRKDGADSVPDDEEENDEDDDDADPTKEQDYTTPYTNCKAGQKKFGGWNKAGIEKYHKLLDKIEKNRKEQAKYILAVEKEALERIRKVAKVDEKDAGRKSKKRATKPNTSEFDEETDDENDYTVW